MLFLPTLFLVALLSWTGAPESLDLSSQCSGLKCWQVSLLPVLQWRSLPPKPLPLCERALSPPECVSQAAFRWHLFSLLAVLQAIGSLLWTHSRASCDTVSEPGLGLVQPPLNCINRPWTERQKWPYLNSRKFMLWPFLIKNHKVSTSAALFSWRGERPLVKADTELLTTYMEF